MTKLSAWKKASILFSRNLTHLSTLAMVFLFCTTLMSGQNIISTIVGGGTSVPQFSTPALGNYADIPGPSSVVTDNQGNVYVASPDANQIYKISAGTMTVFAGQGWPIERPTLANPGKSAPMGNLNAPVGLAIDGSGNIYIADTGAYVIWQVNTSGIMSWIAGVGDAGGGGDGRPAHTAHLTYPAAVATDINGNVYIADTGSNRIRVVNMQKATIIIDGVHIQPGYINTVVGSETQVACPLGTDPCGDGGKATNAQLSSPQGIFVDAAGDIWIADSGDHRVRVVLPNGNIYAYAGTGNNCTGYPNDPCLGDGGPASSAELGNPQQIYVDGGGNLYISDALQQRIRKVTPATAQQPPMISTFAGYGSACSGKNTPPVTKYFCGDEGLATAAYLNRPQGVYGDTLGNVYVGDAANQRVRQVAPGGIINSYAGGGLSDGPVLSSILADNQNVALDTSGNLYIADTGNNRIRKVSGGAISTLAGSGLGNYYGNNNTAATNANLSQPHGLALDGMGNVYIADTFNYVIRVLNTQSVGINVAGVTINPGQLATVAGIPMTACAPNVVCSANGQSARTATLAWPTGVALDSAGNIYITDETAGVVLQVNTAGVIQTVAGQFWNFCKTPTDPCGDGGLATAATLFKPYSVAIDGASNIFVSDAGDNRIRVFTVNGDINAYAFNGVTNFGPDGQPAGVNEYIFPEYIALDSRDNMFVSGSSLYYVIQRIDASAAWQNPVASMAGFQVVSPKYFGYCCDGLPADGPKSAWINNAGVAVDSAERLYISDAGNNRVRLVSSSPTQGLTPVAQVKPFTPPGLQFPSTQVGSQSTLSFTVTNKGSDDLVMGTPSIGAPFSFVNPNPCAGNLVPPDTTCTYQVVFAPTQAITYQGRATVTDNGFHSTSQSVGLSGTGTN
jgi:sugar lactone lactonase YvrE